MLCSGKKCARQLPFLLICLFSGQAEAQKMLPPGALGVLELREVGAALAQLQRLSDELSPRRRMPFRAAMAGLAAFVGLDQRTGLDGLDFKAPVRFYLFSSKQRIALFDVGLSNPALFRSYLDAQAVVPPSLQSVGNAKAILLESVSGQTLACVLRQNRALCQVGLQTGDAPLAPLRWLTEAPTWKPDAALYLELAIAPLAPDLAHWMDRRASRSLPWIPPRKRAHIKRHWRGLGAKVRELPKWAKRLELTLRDHGETRQLEARLVLTPYGNQNVERFWPLPSPGDEVHRWVQGPAIMELTAAMPPVWIARQLERRLGLSLSPSQLTGSLGLMLYGFAPSHAPRVSRPGRGQAAREIHWALSFPSAVAVGLHRPIDPDSVITRLRPDLSLQSQEPRCKHGRRGLDQCGHMLIASLGPGARLATRRRLKHITQPGPPKRSWIDLRLEVDVLRASLALVPDAVRRQQRGYRRMEHLLRDLELSFGNIRSAQLSVEHKDHALRADLRLQRRDLVSGEP